MKIFLYSFCIFTGFLSFGQALPSVDPKIDLQLLTSPMCGRALVKQKTTFNSVFYAYNPQSNETDPYVEIEFKKNHTYRFKKGEIYHLPEKDTMINKVFTGIWFMENDTTITLLWYDRLTETTGNTDLKLTELLWIDVIQGVLWSDYSHFRKKMRNGLKWDALMAN